MIHNSHEGSDQIRAAAIVTLPGKAIVRHCNT
jgi:hypothetical protein